MQLTPTRVNNMSNSEPDYLLRVEDLSVLIERDEGIVKPLNGVNFRVQAGQSIGIVGESGCGKTMTSNALLRILPQISYNPGKDGFFNQGRRSGRLSSDRG